MLNMANIPGFTYHRDDRDPTIPVHYISNGRKEPVSMVVLMPASLPQSRPDRNRTHYHRWTWHESWPESLVLSVSDPALQQSTELNGAWYIHPQIDLIQAIARAVSDEAAAANILNDRIVFYGSSLGGFGAIACASHIKGARAVAEVPQIDFEHWHLSAKRMIERHVINGPLSKLRSYAPERLSLTDRLRFANCVPPIHIISNATDTSIHDQRSFIDYCENTSLPRIGQQRLELTDLASGHKAIPRDEAVKRVMP